MHSYAMQRALDNRQMISLNISQNEAKYTLNCVYKQHWMNIAQY